MTTRPWSSRVARRFRRTSSASWRFAEWWIRFLPWRSRTRCRHSCLRVIMENAGKRRQECLRHVQASSVDQFVGTGVTDLFVRPALLQHALKVRLDDALVTHLETGEELEDGLARALDEAARLTMGDRAITADQIQRELDDHPDTTEPPALEKCGVVLRLRLVFEFRHRVLSPAQTGGRDGAFQRARPAALVAALMHVRLP